MFARFVLFCFLTLQTNLKHFALAYIKNHFVNYSQRFNIIDELSMDKQNETVRRGCEFLQLLFIFPYRMFFLSVSFSFVNLQHAQVLLRVNGEYVESCCCCCITSSSYRLGRGGGGGMPWHSPLRYSYLQYNFSFGQFYAAQSASFSIIIINYQNRMPNPLAKKKVSRAAQLCVPLGHNRTPLYANELRLLQLEQQHLEMGCIHLLTCLSCCCCTLGLWPYESCSPKHFGLICYCCCCCKSLLHTFVFCSPTIFGLQIVFAGSLWV